MCYVLAFFVNDVSGCPPPSLLQPSTFTLDKLKQEVGWEGWSGLLNTETVVWTLAYYALNIVLWKVLPAQESEGTILRTGGRLKYRFNGRATTGKCLQLVHRTDSAVGFTTDIFVLSILAAGTYAQGPDFPVWTFINKNYIPLLTTNVLISYALATWVYIRSFSVQQPKDPQNRELAVGGATGNMIYDWFIGRELNPQVTLPLIGTMDIKTFMEVRPGMLGWIILDLAFVMRQWKTYGYVTDSIRKCLVTLMKRCFLTRPSDHYHHSNNLHA